MKTYKKPLLGAVTLIVMFAIWSSSYQLAMFIQIGNLFLLNYLSAAELAGVLIGIATGICFRILIGLLMENSEGRIHLNLYPIVIGIIIPLVSFLLYSRIAGVIGVDMIATITVASLLCGIQKY